MHKISEVVFFKDEYLVFFEGRLVKAAWQYRGAAEAQLSLLTAGVATLTEDGGVKYDPKQLR